MCCSGCITFTGCHCHSHTNRFWTHLLAAPLSQPQQCEHSHWSNTTHLLWQNNAAAPCERISRNVFLPQNGIKPFLGGGRISCGGGGGDCWQNRQLSRYPFSSFRITWAFFHRGLLFANYRDLANYLVEDFVCFPDLLRIMSVLCQDFDKKSNVSISWYCIVVAAYFWRFKFKVSWFNQKHSIKL